MILWFIIGIGGFIGAILRYLISEMTKNNMISFPLGTLGINVIGSFLLGFIIYTSEYKGFFSEEIRIFLTLGVLGAFTTMSTFSYESFRLLENDEFFSFGLNIVGTIVLTISAVYLGKMLALYLWK
ncbi:MAG: fluoride efflux transporter CrcB [Candidatus Ranarchaeia archaeon]